MESKTRRSQEERSSETRRKVCEATLDALVQVGHEQISTSMIATVAGVSRGALTHQFPKKDDLLVAAFVHLVNIWRSNFPFAEDARPVRLTIEELIDAFWENIFARRDFAAALELMLASRQNTGLGLALREVLEAWIEERDQIAIKLIGAREGDPRAQTLIKLTLSTLRGIAMHTSFDRDFVAVKAQIELWKEAASKIFSV